MDQLAKLEGIYPFLELSALILIAGAAAVAPRRRSAYPDWHIMPTSFVIIPPALADAAAACGLIARPPLPPSGAYHFGATRVVALARRGDEPSLREVKARFPDIRFVRLRPVPSGQIIARDVTDELRERLDADGEGGQD